MTRNEKIELLAPAGNPEKLATAIHYGADAVYLSGKAYSLRNYAGNFTLEEMAKGIETAREAGVRVYVAVNAFPRPQEMEDLAVYLKALAHLQPDALIIADPGVIYLAGQTAPGIPIHLSTQANTTNQWSARFWQSLGITRINAARELRLDEIKAISEAAGLEIEAFAHGAMCMAYSGRCLLSSFMTRRSSNQGQCAHPCRWRYAVVEEFRPGQYMPVAEDETGTYVFNAKDLCMIEHLPKMIDAGIHSLKIEGRLKGLNYLATAIKTYRAAIDAYYASPSAYAVLPEWLSELAHVGPRRYSTGFYLNDPDAVRSGDEIAPPVDTRRFVGKIGRVYDGAHIELAVRNKIQIGDPIDILKTRGENSTNTIQAIRTLDGTGVDTAQAPTRVNIRLAKPDRLRPNELVRKIEEAPIYPEERRYGNL